MILDGWGIGASDATDAVAMAHTPFMDDMRATAPHATLLTYGEHVGLPAGQMGNSEVGHLNIGAGRIVHQELGRIGKAIADGALERNPVLIEAFAAARTSGRKLHFMGLIGEGGVHAHQSHLVALCDMALRAGLKDVYIHAFTDGRDSDPQAALGQMRALEAHLANGPVRVASVCGRYFAMDRDKRWERVRKAFDLLVHGKGARASSGSGAIASSHAAGVTDEFIEPAVVTGADGAPLATIQPGDVVICFNFRTDRCREITIALTQRAIPEHGMTPLPLHYVTMTEYDPTFRSVHVLFTKEEPRMTLGEVVANAGLKQLRAAETEKYPHVTFFFNGGREQPFDGEERILVPSPKVATYDLQPEMSAPQLADAVVKAIGKGDTTFICVNFANPDMVGHTGVFNAIKKAVETTDACAGKVAKAAVQAGYAVLIIADHGNADKALNADGSPNTAHTMNPVPVILLGDMTGGLRNGILADVAPTVLDLLGMEKPAEMTGSSLLERR
ncbi:MAG: 2,3-bisphosphoglycerate-independent phosphoglycerate mutase [Flavobacteriales bacterium]|nr:2,3-bisphosphoglycerate-independent phosphoglycerate mutase [Flavobacteriales bacterium]